MATTVESIERLLEPVARAIRRGDEDQIRHALDLIREIWKKAPKDQANEDESRARGMTHAIEGVLGFALARCGADARRALVETRKHALPILHALGLRARTLPETSSLPGWLGADANASSMTCRELAELIGAKPQNISDLVNAMAECGLVEVVERGASRLVSISDAGAELLEMSLPGWQLTDIKGRWHWDERIVEH